MDLVSGLAPIPLGPSLFMLGKEKLELGEIRERERVVRGRERDKERERKTWSKRKMGRNVRKKREKEVKRW